jgi:hypothetical protein
MVLLLKLMLNEFEVFVVVVVNVSHMVILLVKYSAERNRADADEFVVMKDLIVEKVTP